jgi:5'-nucleotidase
MRKYCAILLIALLVAGIIPAASAQDEPTFALTIMHTNDTHAEHLPGSNGNGGVARQLTVVKQIRAEAANSLLLDAGDRFTGSLFHQQYKGQDNVQIMNLLGYDAMTLGNHEFDNGDEVLAAFLEGLNFPVVNANIDFSASATLADKVVPYVILEKSGEKIGVLGLITPETPILASPGKDLVFSEDLVGAAQAVVDDLGGQGVSKIILLTHIGYNEDVALASQLAGVDIIVGGHSHSFISTLYAGAEAAYPTLLESASGEPVVVVTAASKNTYLGRLDVVFDAAGVLTRWGGDAVLLSRYITPDAEMDAILTSLAGPIEELKQTVIGESSVFLVGDRKVCRVEECNLGNLIGDAMRAATGAEIAFQNGGGIRADIPDGQVTMGHVLTVLPFGNLTSTFSVSGADVWTALENGVSQVENGAGRFLQVSGLRYSWDGSQEPGSRIVSVDVWNAETSAWEPLDLEKVYFAVTNDYVRQGGDGFSVFAENAMNAYDYGTPLDQILAQYITTNSPVAPAVEGRITRMDTP